MGGYGKVWEIAANSNNRQYFTVYSRYLPLFSVQPPSTVLPHLAPTTGGTCRPTTMLPLSAAKLVRPVRSVRPVRQTAASKQKPEQRLRFWQAAHEGVYPGTRPNGRCSQGLKICRDFACVSRAQYVGVHLKRLKVDHSLVAL